MYTVLFEYDYWCIYITLMLQLVNIYIVYIISKVNIVVKAMLLTFLACDHILHVFSLMTCTVYMNCNNQVKSCWSNTLKHRALVQKSTQTTDHITK